MKGVLACLAVAAATWPNAALAQATNDGQASAPGPDTSGTASPAEQARDLGRAGLSAYGQADFQTALGHFRAAEALAHSPVFQLYAARSLLRLGEVDQARVELERIIATTPTEGAPSAWLRARGDAEAELAALAQTTPGGTASEPRNETEGFDADGHVVSVARGEAKMPTWHPEPAPRASAWMRATPNQRGAVVAFGVGAVGLVFSAITGGMAIAESAAVKANCVGTACRQEDLPRALYATQLANLATVGCAVALAGGATGAVLWLWPDEQGNPQVELGVAGPSLRLATHF